MVPTMNQDTISLSSRFETFGKHNKAILIVDLFINGNKVEWSYIDPYAIAHYWLNHRPKYDPSAQWSVFEPFSCTCGASGCAGIWDGIYVKARRHSVEWRMRKNTGYESFMPKRFLSFSREQYLKAREDFIAELRLAKLPDHTLYASFGACPGQEVTLLEFLQEIQI